MVTTELNHVSVAVDDLEESVAFYTDVLGMTPVPTPNFGPDTNVVWLESTADGGQLHVFDHKADRSPRTHHFGVTVDDFEDVYRTATERGAVTSIRDAGDPGQLYELPDGVVQLYLEDPTGHLVEVNWPDSATLAPSIRNRVTPLAEFFPQDDATDATLHLARPE